MSTLVTRAGKGTPLTHNEVDANFTNLNTDKIQSGNTVAALTVTSATINGGSINGTTIGATTASTGAFTSLSDSGNLTFTGTGNRILGDFSNATLTNRVFFQTSTANGNTNISAIPNGTGTRSNVVLYNNSDPTNASTLQLQVQDSTTSNFISGISGTGTYLPLAMWTGGSERLRIDTSGNVGIGTSSPRFKLSIGSTTSTSTATPDTIDLGGTFSSSAGTTPKLRVWYDGTESAGLGISANQFNYIATSSFAHVWYSSGAERMRIDSSGNLLVNATSVAQSGKFEVNGESGDASAFINDSSNSTRPIKCWNKASSGQRMIAFLTGTGATFAGGIECASTTTTYATSSDYRLKENIVPMTGALAKVSQLKPVTYKWKLDGSVGEGFIAHELQAVVPDCVTGEKDAVDENGKPEYQGIDTSFLVATLTAAIQEQQALIENLTNRLNALEGK